MLTDRRRKKCYASLVEELNFGDVECLKYALSKGLGLGIVVGGSIVKVPQVLISGLHSFDRSCEFDIDHLHSPLCALCQRPFIDILCP